MQFICDAPGNKAWFRIETEAEAITESELMRHAVEKHFRLEWQKAGRSYRPTSTAFIEQEIGLKAHIQREMPLFLTLRDDEGNGLATAMLPPCGKDDSTCKPIVVGVENRDPFPDQGDAIGALADHFGLTLDRTRSYPYRR